MQTQSLRSVRVRVMLFGSYAEQLGTETLDLAVPVPATVGAVVAQLRGLPGGAQLPVRPLTALNLAHVAPEAIVGPGDEIAILPPMAGG